MRRFNREVSVRADDRAYGIDLDGKPVRTPGRQTLNLPTRPLAEVIADEWRSQEDDIRPRDMPLTQLANTAIDRTRPHRAEVIEQIAAYGETDLLCYRASSPPDLVGLQAEQWQPLLDWLAGEYGAVLLVTSDIAPVAQSADALLAIFTAVARLDDFVLTGLHALTTASGSVVLGLALSDARVTAEEGWSLSQLDELYQVAKWGDDPNAAAARHSLRDFISTATSFIALSRVS